MINLGKYLNGKWCYSCYIPYNPQLDFELVCIKHMVSVDHLLRYISKHMDFSFITEKVRPYYSETHGRPSIDPVMLFKMLFIGYLYGIRSERQLEQEINMNVGYRWFLGIGMSKKAPDHSTISWNRKHRFKETTVFQDIFDEVIRLTIKNRMVDGRVLTTDSTHLTVDHKFNIISDVHVTPGNVHDSVPYVKRLKHQVEKFGFTESLEAVAVESGT